MDAIRYLDADTILDYLHNSSETYLEGLISKLRFSNRNG